MAEGDWRADPSGRHELRYWDGEKWTEHVSDAGRLSTEAYDGTVAPPRLAGAQVTTPAEPSTVIVKKSHGCLWTAVVVAVVVGVLVIGAIVIFALAVNQAVDTLSKEHAAHAISKAQFDAVAMGTSRADVIAQLAKTPEDAQHFQHASVAGDINLSSSCIYYNNSAEKFGLAVFQLCFDGDTDTATLTTKNDF